MRSVQDDGGRISFMLENLNFEVIIIASNLSSHSGALSFSQTQIQ